MAVELCPVSGQMRLPHTELSNLGHYLISNCFIILISWSDFCLFSCTLLKSTLQNESFSKGMVKECSVRK